MTFLFFKYDLLIILAFILWAPFVKSSHKCLDWRYNKEKDVEKCDDIQGCTKEPIDCPENTPCYSTYRLFEGMYQPMAATCLTEGLCKEQPGNNCLMRPIVPSHKFQFFSCCCFGPVCNINIVWSETLLATTTTTTLSTDKKYPVPMTPLPPEDKKLLQYLLPSILGFIALCFIILFLLKRRKKLTSSFGEILVSQEHSTSDIKNVHLLEVISYGQFSCVRKAMYDGKMVAIKSINSQGYRLWETEKKMYVTYDLKHEHIVNFVAAEKNIEHQSVQYWIVTEYYSKGSLADYLNITVFDFQSLLRIALSIAKGLVYLHAENKDITPKKPIITHYDLKSRNILVKSDLSCCISDFGLAHSYFIGENSTNVKLQVGTPRYMSPELLQGVMSNQEDSRLCVDIYSLALVLWEVLTRCNIDANVADTYHVPYDEFVNTNPSVKDMLECVVENRHRPHLKQEWKEHHLMGPLCETIVECWDEESDARLSAQCVLERLKCLQTEYKQTDARRNSQLAITTSNYSETNLSPPDVVVMDSNSTFSVDRNSTADGVAIGTNSTLVDSNSSFENDENTVLCDVTESLLSPSTKLT